MTERFASRRNLDFILNEVFDVQSLTMYPYYKAHNQETLTMIVDAAWEIANDLLFPLYKEMDNNPPQWVDGRVKVHPLVKDFLKECGQCGWIKDLFNVSFDGRHIPNLIQFGALFIFRAANYSLAAYPDLIAGAANLIARFGSKELQNQYLEKMFSGKWQGTMVMTELDVGTSISDIATLATDTGKGYYLIKGKKSFITAGSHEAVENTVHLLLARIKGAPAGINGVSLFVVPHKRVNGKGQLEYNDLTCSGIDHKMGYRGCPSCQLKMGENNNCHGYLVGESNMGVMYMFEMINKERINVGIAASAKSSAVYQVAIDYSRKRLQGRKCSEKDPNTPHIPIIEHPEIKRLLLLQKAVVEGSLSLAMQLGKYLDLIAVGEDEERHGLLVELLIPIVKAYPSEMNILATSAAIQCLGGYGYCTDFLTEQYYRDIRIDTIHEGTTAIQGQDILGRKVIMNQGRAYVLFLEEVNRTIRECRYHSELQECSDKLQDALALLQDVTASLIGFSTLCNNDEFLADATLYLELFGHIAIGWQWLLQAGIAQKALNSQPAEKDIFFYRGKMYTCRYYFGYELPKIEGLARRLKSTDGLTVEMPVGCFQD